MLGMSAKLSGLKAEGHYLVKVDTLPHCCMLHRAYLFELVWTLSTSNHAFYIRDRSGGLFFCRNRLLVGNRYSVLL